MSKPKKIFLEKSIKMAPKMGFLGGFGPHHPIKNGLKCGGGSKMPFLTHFLVPHMGPIGHFGGSIFSGLDICIGGGGGSPKIGLNCTV